MAKAGYWYMIDAEMRKRRVSNPVCYPRFRVSASVIVQVAAFATGVPPNIYEFHLYTRNSATPSDTLAIQFRMHVLS